VFAGAGLVVVEGLVLAVGDVMAVVTGAWWGGRGQRKSRGGVVGGAGGDVSGVRFAGWEDRAADM